MDDTLKSYVYAIAKLSPKPEAVIRFSPVLDNRKEIYVIDPFSVRNICLNTGLDADDMEYALSASGFAGKIASTEIRRSDDGIDYSIAYDRYEIIQAPEAMQPMHYRVDNVPEQTSTMIDMLVHLISRRNLAVSGRLSTTDEAIFEIKNEVEIPDDFMPEHLMSLVEAKGLPDFGGISRDIQISWPRRNLFMVGGEGANGIEFIQYLVPAQEIEYSVSYSIESLKLALKRSYAELENESCYSSLIKSRVLRTAQFNLKRRNSRKLPPQLRNRDALSILESLGILDLDGETPAISSSVTPDSLLQLKSEAEVDVKACAEKWLSGSLRLSDR